MKTLTTTVPAVLSVGIDELEIPCELELTVNYHPEIPTRINPHGFWLHLYTYRVLVDGHPIPDAGPRDLLPSYDYDVRCKIWDLAVEHARAVGDAPTSESEVAHNV